MTVSLWTDGMTSVDDDVFRWLTQLQSMTKVVIESRWYQQYINCLLCIDDNSYTDDIENVYCEPIPIFNIQFDIINKYIINQIFEL